MLIALWPKEANTILPLIRGQGKRHEAIFLPGVLQVYQEPHRRYTTTWIRGEGRRKGGKETDRQETGTRFEYKPRFSLSGPGYRGMHREGRCLERVGIYYSVLFMLPISLLSLSLSSAPSSLLSRYYSPFSTSTLSNCRLNSILRSCSHFILVLV